MMQTRPFHVSRVLISSLLPRFLALSLVSVGLAAAPTVARADAATTAFSGQAYVAKATVTTPLLGPVTVGPVGDTGSLSSQGGSLDNSLLAVSLTNPVDNSSLLTGEVGHAATIGQGDRSRSEASVAAVNLNVAGQTITADFLMARAMAVCGSGGPSVSGSSELANLVVDNQAVTVSGAPNQTIQLPNGSIIINEQSSNTNGNYGSIDVNALHVILTGVADVVIAHAHADITCSGQPVCTGGDFLTGGGWILTPSGARANFAVAGGIKNGAFWGHLLYIDHGTDMRVKGTGVTAYAAGSTPNSRRIDGTDEVSGASGSYSVEAADNGEPGRNIDTFSISLIPTGYTAGGTLAGGNIQLHQPCK